MQWLLSAEDLSKRPLNLASRIIGMHVVDAGYGPNVLATLRQMDSELVDGSSDASKWSLDQHARSGVVGRSFGGVWQKLLEVCAREGVTTLGSELDDSPLALMVSLASIVHHISSDSADSVEFWQAQLGAQIQELAVSKHAKVIVAVLRDEG
jgi:hypothetical protein